MDRDGDASASGAAKRTRGMGLCRLGRETGFNLKDAENRREILDKLKWLNEEARNSGSS